MESGTKRSAAGEQSCESNKKVARTIVIDDSEEENHANDDAIIDPIDPVSCKNDPSAWIDPQAGLKFVIYMAISEPLDSKYSKLLKTCQESCSTQIHQHCFQQDQTRHITMVSTFTLRSFQDANRIYIPQDVLDTKFGKDPIPIAFNSLQDWKAGVYLKVSEDHEKMLKQLVKTSIKGIPATHKLDCNHLSLYRQRNFSRKVYFPQVGKLRKLLQHKEWGHVLGVSIRIKQVGTPYSMCRVLWNSA